ncbi:hypothetical protein TWF132_005236 [Orbilia oligospora]|nr:hypothetical protein TWF132_005236 [Orbilia oligospora]
MNGPCAPNLTVEKGSTVRQHTTHIIQHCTALDLDIHAPVHIVNPFFEDQPGHFFAQAESHRIEALGVISQSHTSGFDLPPTSAASTAFLLLDRAPNMIGIPFHFRTAGSREPGLLPLLRWSIWPDGRYNSSVAAVARLLNPFIQVS